jgi:hypothetical protein
MTKQPESGEPFGNGYQNIIGGTLPYNTRHIPLTEYDIYALRRSWENAIAAGKPAMAELIEQVADVYRGETEQALNLNNGSKPDIPLP